MARVVHVCTVTAVLLLLTVMCWPPGTHAQAGAAAVVASQTARVRRFPRIHIADRAASAGNEGATLGANPAPVDSPAVTPLKARVAPLTTSAGTGTGTGTATPPGNEVRTGKTGG